MTRVLAVLTMVLTMVLTSAPVMMLVQRLVLTMVTLLKTPTALMLMSASVLASPEKMSDKDRAQHPR